MKAAEIIMNGKELRRITNESREKVDNTKKIEDERTWLLKMCTDAAKQGIDYFSPDRLEDTMLTNLVNEVLFDWCKSVGLKVSGSRDKKGTCYTFYW